MQIEKIYENFFKMMNRPVKKDKKFYDAVDVVKAGIKKEARDKIDNLLKDAMNNGDTEKIVMILERNFNINDDQFMLLCETQIDKNNKFSHAVIEKVLRDKYMHEIRHQIDKELKAFLDAGILKDIYGFCNLAKKIIKVWPIFDKKKEFDDKDYAFEFREIIEPLCNMNCDYYSQHYQSFHTNLLELKMISNEFSDLIKERYSDDYRDFESSIRQADLMKFRQELDSAAVAFNDLDSVKEHIKRGLRENLNHIGAINLPQSAQKLVEYISKTASELHSLHIEDSLEFENLYKKRLPQVLQEYINISPRYRERLKNTDDDPEKVMQEALIFIKDKIDAIFDKYQNAHHQQQKITRQYLKHI